MRNLSVVVFVASSLAVLTSGCGKGALSFSPPERSLDAALGGSDAGDQFVGDDAAVPGTDAWNPSADASTLPDGTSSPDADPVPCMPGDCGPGASCGPDEVCVCDEGLLGDPAVGCSLQNPCENVECPTGASCNPDGSCSCDSFFTDDGAGGCTPQEPAADIASRTRAEVCDIWTSSYPRASDDFFLIEPTTPCEQGVIHPEEMRTALHVTSVFRMLVGLYPVSTDRGQLVNTQACATTLAAESAGLTHQIPSDFECYTPEAAAGAGSSNLAMGVSNPAGTVGLYVGDNGVASLGHRRWVFNPSMGATAFGHRGAYGCMYAFGGGRNHNPEFVAYPAPGFFPRAALLGKWSIHGGGNYTDNHTVTITNLADNSSVAVTDITAPSFGNLASTLSWSAQAPTDVELRISIADNQGTLVQEYTTTLVDCP